MAKKFLSVILVVAVLICGAVSVSAETETWMDSDGNSLPLSHTLKNAYNSKGQLAQTKYYEKSGRHTYTLKFKYDAKGFPAEQRTYYGDEIVETRKVKCDDNGNIIENKNYNADGVLLKGTSFTFKHTLDKNGRAVKTKVYMNGVLQYTVDSKYDEKGNQTESKSDSYGVFTKTYQYDSKGNISQAVTYFRDKVYQCSLFTYNAKGQCTKEVAYDINALY